MQRLGVAGSNQWEIIKLSFLTRNCGDTDAHLVAAKYRTTFCSEDRELVKACQANLAARFNGP